MNRRSRTLRLAALALTLVAGAYAAGAAAQWAWKDDNGRLVYSNLPPPPTVKPAQIMRQPGPGAVMIQPGSADGEVAKPATAPAATGAPKTLAERDADFRKRQQERADSERKAQDEQQKAAQKAVDCERSRGYLKGLEDGQRMVRTDPSGNREVLDDAQRAVEIERTRKSVAQFCN